MTNLKTPMMEDSLVELVMKLWPPMPVRVEVIKVNSWFETLRQYAKDEGLELLSGDSYFVIELHYDFMYFEYVDGCWNARFKIMDRVTCFLVDDGKKKKIRLQNIRSSFIDFLVLISNLQREVMYAIPPVAVVDVPQKMGTGAEKTIPIWMFVK